MKEILPIDHFESVELLGGDKSVSHRAILLNAVTGGKAEIRGGSQGKDCLSTIACMNALGANIRVKDNGRILIRGTDKLREGKILDCGNSATTMRLLAGYLAGKGVPAVLTGDESLMRRPMKRLEDPIRRLGGNLSTKKGRAPITIGKGRLHGGEVATDVPSAQIKSALLLAGLNTREKLTVYEKTETRDHTERLLAEMGAEVEITERDGMHAVRVSRGNFHAVDVDVPVDISSASFFLALAALKGKALMKNVGVNRTRRGILTAFDRLGVRYELRNNKLVGGEERADIYVEKSDLHAIEISEEEVPTMIDELPLIALLCSFADGESVIRGAGELKVKESDRLKTTGELIKNLGGDCSVLEDGFVIRGRERLVGGRVDSYSDHRIAMTATIGLLASEKGGVLVDDECVDISFPDFFERLQKAGARIN